MYYFATYRLLREKNNQCVTGVLQEIFMPYLTTCVIHTIVKGLDRQSIDIASDQNGIYYEMMVAQQALMGLNMQWLPSIAVCRMLAANKFYTRKELSNDIISNDIGL